MVLRFHLPLCTGKPLPLLAEWRTRENEHNLASGSTREGDGEEDVEEQEILWGKGAEISLHSFSSRISSFSRGSQCYLLWKEHELCC